MVNSLFDFAKRKLNQVARIHSPSGHMLGTCWCIGTPHQLKTPYPYSLGPRLGPLTLADSTVWAPHDSDCDVCEDRRHEIDPYSWGPLS